MSSSHHSRALISSVVPLPRDWNRRAGRPRQTWLRAQLNLMSLHSTLVWQLPIIEHKIGRHGGRSWKRQRPLDKSHDDDDDDDDRLTGHRTYTQNLSCWTRFLMRCRASCRKPCLFLIMSLYSVSTLAFSRCPPKELSIILPSLCVHHTSRE